MSTRDPWEIASELARALEAAGVARATAATSLVKKDGRYCLAAAARAESNES
jgi:hypothetical protein